LTAVYGTEYQIGSGTVLLCKNISHYKELWHFTKLNPSTSFLTDPNSGPTDDWAKGVAGIPYSYTIELRDQGPVYGFLLPPRYKTPNKSYNNYSFF
jgi:hypothetical protein